jgi:hypothetical protein
LLQKVSSPAFDAHSRWFTQGIFVELRAVVSSVDVVTGVAVDAESVVFFSQVASAADLHFTGHFSLMLPPQWQYSQLTHVKDW